MTTLTDLEWKTLRAFPDYEINHSGIIRRCDNGMKLKFRISEKGISKVNLSYGKRRMTTTVARLVYETFAGTIPYGWRIGYHAGTSPELHNLYLVSRGTAPDAPDHMPTVKLILIAAEVLGADQRTLTILDRWHLLAMLMKERPKWPGYKLATALRIDTHTISDERDHVRQLLTDCPQFQATHAAVMQAIGRQRQNAGGDGRPPAA